MKLITLSNVKDLSPEEQKASIDQKKREYRKMLNDICPITEIRVLAKKLAKQEVPCDKCAYSNNPMCMAPYSDIHMEVLGIDPCYEGILLFLKNEMVKAHESAQVKTLEQELEEANEILLVAKEAINAFASIVSRYDDCDLGIRMIMIKVAEDMQKNANDVFDDYFLDKN